MKNRETVKDFLQRVIVYLEAVSTKQIFHKEGKNISRKVAKRAKKGEIIFLNHDLLVFSASFLAVLTHVLAAALRAQPYIYDLSVPACPG